MGGEVSSMLKRHSWDHQREAKLEADNKIEEKREKTHAKAEEKK